MTTALVYLHLVCASRASVVCGATAGGAAVRRVRDRLQLVRHGARVLQGYVHSPVFSPPHPATTIARGRPSSDLWHR
jgi:hypothetical protein